MTILIKSFSNGDCLSLDRPETIYLYRWQFIINQLLAHLEVGHEVDTAAKPSVANSKQNFPASPAGKFGRWGKTSGPLEFFYFFDVIWTTGDSFVAGDADTLIFEN